MHRFPLISDLLQIHLQFSAIMNCKCLNSCSLISAKHLIKTSGMARCLSLAVTGNTKTGTSKMHRRHQQKDTVLSRLLHDGTKKNLLKTGTCDIFGVLNTDNIDFGIRKRVVKRKFSSSDKSILQENLAEKSLYKEEKTELIILNEGTDAKRSAYPFVYKYSTKGFTIGGNKVYGSVALLHKCIFSWKVMSHHQITPQSLSLFSVAEPKLEILVLGLGDRVSRLNPEVLEYCRKFNIALEILDTPNACATYNFLTEEGRITAAGLIPPQTIKI